MSPEGSDLEASPETLVAQALDPAAEPTKQDEALLALRPLVLEIAACCARRMVADDQVRQDLVDQAFNHVAMRLGQYNREQGLFRPWLQGVLTHFGQDLRRRRARYARRHAPLPFKDVPEPLPTEEHAGQLTRNFAALRSELDRCSWPPASGVDYFAVLLVLLRVEVADAYRRASGELLVEEVCSRTALLLPWRTAEEERTIRWGLPPLRALWAGMAPRLEQANGRAALLGALNASAPPTGAVSYNALAQWCFRARKLARERLGEASWQEHGFARLLGPAPAEGP